MNTTAKTMSTMAKVMVVSAFTAVGAAGGLFVPLFLGFTSTNINDYEIKLKPQVGTDQLVVSKSNRCDDKKHEGCLLFDVDKLGIIDFYLPGSRNNTKTCDNSSNVITKIQLTTTVSDEGTVDDKGDFTDLPLPAWIKTDAFPDVDLATGVVYEAVPPDTGKGRVRLINLNRNTYVEDEVMQFWYKVTVTSCSDDTETWTTDPRGDNKGTKF